MISIPWLNKDESTTMIIQEEVGQYCIVNEDIETGLVGQLQSMSITNNTDFQEVVHSIFEEETRMIVSEKMVPTLLSTPTYHATIQHHYHTPALIKKQTSNRISRLRKHKRGAFSKACGITKLRL